MKRLTVKFKVAEVRDFGNKNKEARLTAVSGDCEENKSFSLYTPRADANILINNPEMVDFFEPATEVYAVFTNERPDFKQHEDLLTYALNVIRFPGRYNNQETRNLRVAISNLLGDQVDPDKMIYRLWAGGLSTLNELSKDASKENFEHFACMKIGQKMEWIEPGRQQTVERIK